MLHEEPNGEEEEVLIRQSGGRGRRPLGAFLYDVRTALEGVGGPQKADVVREVS